MNNLINYFYVLCFSVLALICPIYAHVYLNNNTDKPIKVNVVTLHNAYQEGKEDGEDVEIPAGRFANISFSLKDIPDKSTITIENIK